MAGTKRFDVGKTDSPKPASKTLVDKADSIDKKEPPAKAPKRTAQKDVAPKKQGPDRAKAR
jgi:hypothetical protein